MSNALLQPMSAEEFLAWERRQELRYEFDGFRAVAMTGGTVEHCVIGTHLVRALEDRLQGKPCRAFRGELKVLVAGRVCYPDAMVTCFPVPRGSDIVALTVVVFEISSHSTAVTDRVAKNEEYRTTPSIQRYVMLEQTAMAATAFERSDGDWVGHLVTGESTLAMPEIGVDLPLAEIYVGVEFPLPDEAD